MFSLSVLQQQHTFTKLTKVVLTYWKAMSYTILMFLDDGLGGSSTEVQAWELSKLVWNLLKKFGFITAEGKSNWTPFQKVIWLGFMWDMSAVTLYASPSRTDRLEASLDLFMHRVDTSLDSLLQLRYLAAVEGYM